MSISLARPALKASILAGKTPPWVLKHIRAQYLVAVALSTPPWVDRKALRAIQKRAQEATRRTGVRHVADHIVPVTHPRVCGLSVPWNFQVIHWRSNAVKSNHWCPEQDDLFDWPAGTTLDLFPTESEKT